MTKNAVALCPGSFDPITLGHEDIIRRAAGLFGKVYVAVMVNGEKNYMFSEEERTRMCRKVFEDTPNVEVVCDDGLLVDFARKVGANVIVKGIRDSSDWDYEDRMAQANAAMAPELETVFIASRPERKFISSTLVRTLASYGRDISGLVSGKISDMVKNGPRTEK